MKAASSTGRRSCRTSPCAPASTYPRGRTKPSRAGCSPGWGASRATATWWKSRTNSPRTSTTTTSTTVFSTDSKSCPPTVRASSRCACPRPRCTARGSSGPGLQPVRSGPGGGAAGGHDADDDGGEQDHGRGDGGGPDQGFAVEGALGAGDGNPGEAPRGGQRRCDAAPVEHCGEYGDRGGDDDADDSPRDLLEGGEALGGEGRVRVGEGGHQHPTEVQAEGAVGEDHLDDAPGPRPAEDVHDADQHGQQQEDD